MSSICPLLDWRRPKTQLLADDHNFLLDTQLTSPLLGETAPPSGEPESLICPLSVPSTSFVSATAVQDDRQVKVGVSSPVEEIIQNQKKETRRSGTPAASFNETQGNWTNFLFVPSVRLTGNSCSALTSGRSYCCKATEDIGAAAAAVNLLETRLRDGDRRRR